MRGVRFYSGGAYSNSVVMRGKSQTGELCFALTKLPAPGLKRWVLGVLTPWSHSILSSRVCVASWGLEGVGSLEQRLVNLPHVLTYTTHLPHTTPAAVIVS